MSTAAEVRAKIDAGTEVTLGMVGNSVHLGFPAHMSDANKVPAKYLQDWLRANSHASSTVNNYSVGGYGTQEVIDNGVIATAAAAGCEMIFLPLQINDCVQGDTVAVFNTKTREIIADATSEGMGTVMVIENYADMEYYFWFNDILGTYNPTIHHYTQYIDKASEIAVDLGLEIIDSYTTSRALVDPDESDTFANRLTALGISDLYHVYAGPVTTGADSVHLDNEGGVHVGNLMVAWADDAPSASSSPSDSASSSASSSPSSSQSASSSPSSSSSSSISSSASSSISSSPSSSSSSSASSSASSSISSSASSSTSSSPSASSSADPFPGGDSGYNGLGPTMFRIPMRRGKPIFG